MKHTRQRILQTSRELLNVRGAASVTTAEIAQACAINEGNLYYHFQRKEQLALALFDAYEQELGALIARQLASRTLTARPDEFLREVFRFIWSWRFFYRDAASMQGIAPALMQRQANLTRELHAQLKQVILRLNEIGVLVVPDAAIDRLVVNAWMIAHYWIVYQQTHRGSTQLTEVQVSEGVKQLISLFRPYVANAEATAPVAEAAAVRTRARADAGRA